MFDLSMQELTQVCIGSNDVGLHFYRATNSSAKWARGASVHMGAGFDLTKNGISIASSTGDGFGYQAGVLTVLLRQCITALTCLPRNELLLSFSNNYCLRLISGFESYQLDVAGDIVDVAFRPENS